MPAARLTALQKWFASEVNILRQPGALGILGTVATSVETKVLKDQEKERVTQRIEKHLAPSPGKGQ